ncbi:DUF58 domain-containing protein [Limisalsivibrio acetivorans]|uniref:DUF58 domain-containing protein n=1 Tax=Limisalsivibrio acetivorans TaxID=1304888 RepID=UPI0003B6CC73|nr:DUF58 domain-containing protein [Limisalsivibrio acetivorans]
MKKRVKKPGAPGVIRIKKAGWIYITLTIIMGFGAVNTANNLVYIIVAIMLGFMGVSGFFGVNNLKELEIELIFPDEVYAGRSTPVEVRLKNNRKFLPVFLIRIHVNDQNVLFPFVETGASDSRFMELNFERRGEVKLHDVWISSVFPFNFFIRFKNFDDDSKPSALVFPAPVSCPVPADARWKREEKGETDSETRGFDSELLSIRDYISGDPLRYIHWKATARTGVVKVKELSALTVPPVIIDFSSIMGDLEHKLSCAVWIINGLSAKGTPVGLRMPSKTFPPVSGRTHRLSMLKELALYD